jgi:hypothetical protein
MDRSCQSSSATLAFRHSLSVGRKKRAPIPLDFGQRSNARKGLAFEQLQARTASS